MGVYANAMPREQKEGRSHSPVQGQVCEQVCVCVYMRVCLSTHTHQGMSGIFFS